ncbi:hypothetical protein [Nocardia aurea]|jgi:hypothetical protein|uniref:Uncharacterized protein n=1 Tax=Nocardia aurea TaxID=2144174 RepID=A0ABV3FT21_9NOCA|nr:hypothetical protein [Planctomycetaceae bacterium]
MTRDYTDFPELSHLYLEDSYVLKIVEGPTELRFFLEAVLTPGSPDYHDPKQGEQYCYQNGELIFLDVRSVKWVARSMHEYRDATGSEDLGNIDSLIERDGIYEVEGDWGRVEISSARDPQFIGRSAPD